ncbi:Replication protein A 32 kDa subunit [Phytophthora palmivora]|uniref:Replication protein A 32 kDa subunit n=1 Tax=Phytophthora palmivora TaxID=4796 RepID=A0A2P4XFE9_9STRA|nr:Replication protein A 32 kDa subunit [Phytophthora palmivora]
MNYGGGYEAYGNDDYGNGGGGFMSSQPSGSQSTPTKRSGAAQSILPVSIKQLQTVNADDDTLRLDGQEVSTVRLIGLLTNLTPHSTSLRFQLDDGSGAFDCQYFVTADDADASEGEMNRLREGSYVRVVGKLRTFQGKASLSCFNVTPVEDMNELTHHLLEVIYVHCYNTKGPLNNGKADVTMTSFNTPTKAAPGGNQWNQPSAGGFGGSMDYGMMDSNFSPEQKAILDVLGTCTSDRGLKIDQIFADLRGQMTEPQLRSALNYLTSEGHVYSTIDEDHFKRTA